MAQFKSLKRQIVGAYILFTLTCFLFFSIVGTILVEGIEAKLVDDRLEDVANWAVPRHASGLPVEMPSGVSFHFGDTIPVSLRLLPDGVQEVEVERIGLHVMKGRTAAGPWVVVDHESDYNKVEQAVYSLFGICFIGYLVLSVLLGRFMARRFVSPIMNLTAAVMQRQPKLPVLDENNELGILARAFDAYSREMRDYLDRERFFTGDVSHELRTPLTVIAGAAEILQGESAGNPALAAPVERISRAVQDAVASVEVLLTLARSPHMNEAEQVALADVARLETERFQFMVASKNVTLRFEGGQLQVRAPRKLLEASIGNLVRNACLYTAQGQVVVRIDAQCLQVRDTGEGLPEAVRSMLSGADTSGLPGSAGTGLGLALVKRICEYIGAELKVRTPAGGGTIMEIDFSRFTKN